MKPLVILDTTALHGRKPFTRADAKLLLELSRGGHLRLVVPDVVLQELSRQWAEGLAESVSDMERALKSANDALVVVEGTQYEMAVPLHPRAEFYDFARGLLVAKHAEVAPVPEVSVLELLAKDLNVRKPFDREGRGFRDALIWETVRLLCAELSDPKTPVVFVTNNTTDFCQHKSPELHPDLRLDLPQGQAFEVVASLHALRSHGSIHPLAERLRVLQATFTRERVEDLVDAAISELHGVDVEQALGVYAGDGFFDVPISTGLNAAAFDEIIPDNSSIESEIFHSGDGELTIQVYVKCEVSLEGFVDKSDYFLSGDDDGLTILEDWNSHVFHASEYHQVRFKLSAEFPDSDLGDLDGVVLTVDEADELE